MSIPSSFSSNEFSFTNNHLIKLYDSLSVIDYSLWLIEQYGRNEFEPVIMQQLRMIFTNGNDYYDKNVYEKKGLSESDNSFSLFDILGDFKLEDSDGNVSLVRDLKLFPKIKFAVSNHEERDNSDSKYYFYSKESIVEKGVYNYEEFLKQPYISVVDAEGNEKYKNIEQCIKLLANKLQGAHYQVHIKKWQLDIVQISFIISQTLGSVVLEVLMPLCKYILGKEDKLMNSNLYTSYFEKNEFVSFDAHRATPIFDND